jgi:hypothetical protein
MAVQQMSELPAVVVQKTSDLLAGTACPVSGVYVVSHWSPCHAAPHEVLIVATSILPECNVCAGARFSLKHLPIQLIDDNEFFITKGCAL